MPPCARPFPHDLDAIAVETDNGLDYSWRDLDRATAMMANLLQSLDLPEGSRIAVQVEKSVEAMMLYLATLRAGYVFLPLNTAYQSAEIEYFIGNAEPAVVVCSRKNFGWVSKIAFKAGTQHVFTPGRRPHRLAAGARRAVHATATTAVQRQADDLAAILYTSGTTGRSKGAMLTHGNLLSNAQVLKDYWGWQPGDVLIHALPIFHVHGLFVAMHGALLNGSKMIWLAKFDPKRVIAEAARGHGVHGRAHAVRAPAGRAGPDARGRAQHAPVHRRLGAAADRDLQRLAGAHRPHHPGALRHERDRHADLQPLRRRRTASAAAAPWVSRCRACSLRVQDDDGQPLPVGEIGGIQVKGPNVFKGYWRMPEKTKEEFTADGYFKTGDVGKIDERGYVDHRRAQQGPDHQRRLQRLPGRDRGLHQRHAGRGRERGGRRAASGLRRGGRGRGDCQARRARWIGEQIIAALKAQLANFKIPKRCFVVDELPRNTMGKVQKNLLREQHKHLFA